MKELLLLIGLSVFPTWAALAEPPAPQAITVISCRVDDLTGRPGRQDPSLAAKGWRDLEWTIKDGELQCKREVVELQDNVTMVAPETPALHPNFSKFAQCAAVAMQFSPTYERAHPGWAVMAVGCPTRIETDGILTGWKMPDCPREVGGIPIHCKFDESLI